MWEAERRKAERKNLLSSRLSEDRTTEPLGAFLCSQQRAESGGSSAQALLHFVGHRLTHLHSLVRAARCVCVCVCVCVLLFLFWGVFLLTAPHVGP